MPAIEVISTYTEGDTRPVLSRNYGAGTVDITDWTITLRIKRPDAPVLEKVASIDEGEDGDFSFTFAAGELIAGDGQEAEIEFDDGADGIFTQANIQFNVRKQLG